MTYKQIQKRIARLKEAIKYLYKIQHEVESKEEKRLLGDTINFLVGYEYYITNIKEYFELPSDGKESGE